MHFRVVEPKDAGFRSFAEFYPFYLREHLNPVSRALHYTGTWIVVACLIALIVTGNWWWLAGMLVAGYGFAWLGHFRFEHNKPATFRHPFYSLAGDFRMWWELNLGKLRFRE
ncbi:MAG: DUF962 domain-containing protein [Steroidobacteraceae bacterium]|nr:DUF962 domain-containing protein [Steroidobacteraceae bacterium]